MMATRSNYAMVWIARRWRRLMNYRSFSVILIFQKLHSHSHRIIINIIIFNNNAINHASTQLEPSLQQQRNCPTVSLSSNRDQYWLCVSGTLSTRVLHRVGCTNVQSMIASVFYHTDYVHLFVNMVAIHRYGTQLFVRSSSKAVWQSVWIILISYLVCGIGAFHGIETMSKFHDRVWESSKRDTRNSFRCTHWLCDTVNDVFGSGTDDVTSRITSAFSDASFVSSQ